MLVALVYLFYTAGGSFDLAAWRTVKIPLTAQVLLFLAFLAPSRSRCRCGRCTPGCPTPTSRLHRRLGGAGGDHAQARRLRLPALLAADHPDAAHELAWFIIAISLVAWSTSASSRWCRPT